MRAITIRNGAFSDEQIDAPNPGPGQVLVRTLVCGICGTDIHARHHIHDFVAGLKRAGGALPIDPDGSMVLGHEFTAEILDHGPETSGTLKPGTRVVGLPLVTGPQGPEFIGYSNRFPGALAQQMILTEKLLFEVPNGLSDEISALTEPFAVGAHAVARAGITGNVVVMVVGCGPIGLSVIAALRARGIGPVIAMDYAAGRRRFAEQLGADEAVDPAQEDAASVWARHRAGRGDRRAVAFECVGRPQVPQQIIDAIPRRALVVVVGNSLEPSTIDQVVAFNKELDICFSVTYSPGEFRQTLHDLAEGRIGAEPLVTGVMPPEQTEAAFDALADGEHHAKLLIDFRT